MTNLKKVLIIDDCKTTVEILRDSLINNGYDVDFVHDGIAGINRAEFWKPNLIILDIILPEMDGLSCLYNLKRKENLKHIPVIIYTIKKDMHDLFKDKGIIAYIEKSDNLDELLYSVRGVFL